MGLNQQVLEIISVECRSYKFYNKCMKRIYCSKSIPIKWRYIGIIKKKMKGNTEDNIITHKINAISTILMIDSLSVDLQAIKSRKPQI